MNFFNPSLQSTLLPLKWARPISKFQSIFFFFSPSSPQPRKPLLIYNKPRQSTRRETINSPTVLAFPYPFRNVNTAGRIPPLIIPLTGPRLNDASISTCTRVNHPPPGSRAFTRARISWKSWNNPIPAVAEYLVGQLEPTTNSMENSIFGQLATRIFKRLFYSNTKR